MKKIMCLLLATMTVFVSGVSTMQAEYKIFNKKSAVTKQMSNFSHEQCSYVQTLELENSNLEKVHGGLASGLGCFAAGAAIAVGIAMGTGGISVIFGGIYGYVNFCN
jgi:hypothetical protein